MGFLDGILTDSLGSQGGQSQQPQDTSGRSTAGMILGLLGGVTGSGILSGLGGMFNNEARLKFLDAQRPRLLKLAQDEGIIDQKKADFLQQMPLEAAMPDLHDINQQLFAQKASKTPTLFYNPATQQLEAHTLQEGQKYPKGLLTPGMYNAGQSQQERQAAEDERQREFGINKQLQEQNFGATMAQRQATLAASEQEHRDSLALRREEFEGRKTGEGKPIISWRTETDSNGRTTQVPYRYDAATNSEVPLSVAGSPGGLRGRLNASQQKQVDAIHEVENTLPVVQEYVNALPPDTTPAVMAREYAKYRAPFGALGAPSKEFTDYFDILGQLKPTLMGARMGGLSKSAQLLSKLSPHIPDPLDPPKRAMEKMQAFQRGAFDSTMSAIIGNGGAPPPPAIMGGSAPMPPASMIPEGHKRTFTNGKTYQNVGGVVSEVTP